MVWCENVILQYLNVGIMCCVISKFKLWTLIFWTLLIETVGQWDSDVEAVRLLWLENPSGITEFRDYCFQNVDAQLGVFKIWRCEHWRLNFANPSGQNAQLGRMCDPELYFSKCWDPIVLFQNCDCGIWNLKIQVGIMRFEYPNWCFSKFEFDILKFQNPDMWFLNSVNWWTQMLKVQNLGTIIWIFKFQVMKWADDGIVWDWRMLNCESSKSQTWIQRIWNFNNPAAQVGIMWGLNVEFVKVQNLNSWIWIFKFQIDKS